MNTISLSEKKSILINYFRKHGKLPCGALTIDSNTATVGNVSVDGSYYGTFDYIKEEFIDIA
ncbi:MAG: hypothetical protein ACI4J1_02290 [Ruminiclostridium sp.]